MIDIEFIVQFLVLAHAAQFPELVKDIENIELLKLCGRLGLIEEELAGQVADAYREFRRLQHLGRLQGIEQVRIAADNVTGEIDKTIKLWLDTLLEYRQKNSSSNSKNI